MAGKPTLKIAPGNGPERLHLCLAYDEHEMLRSFYLPCEKSTRVKVIGEAAGQLDKRYAGVRGGEFVAGAPKATLQYRASSAHDFDE